MGELDDERAGGVHKPGMVVGLAASAGGIAALSPFFVRLPPERDIAYVVILHPSPGHESHLAEALQRASALPVAQVGGHTDLEPGHVYVVPPNQRVAVGDGTLRLEPMTQPGDRRPPVDMFFRTLADAYGARAAAVVLSGTGPNGSSGLKRVKERGGLTMAQDPHESEHGDMPHNAIATGLVDVVLPVSEMPGRLLAYHAGLVRRTVPEEPPADADEGVASLWSAQDCRDILTVLRLRTGHDFSSYKPATLQRRVERRLNLRGIASLGDYARLLREDPGEPRALMTELLISVTSFFRDREVWEVVERRIVPLLFERRQAGDHVRVWCAGCATGEEAYSLAMLLAEQAGSLTTPPAVQVFATDLDERSVAHAREGLYTDAETADVTPERLPRFFHRERGGWRVRRELREMVLFAHHNVIRDPPFSHLDLISCRNLLIYLNRRVQRRLIETFHFGLRPGGYLLVGTSEAADAGTDLFAPFEKHAHIFESRAVISRPAPPVFDRAMPAIRPLPRVPQPPVAPERISPGELHLRLLEQYAPPSLVVNEENLLLHASPGAARFLRVPAGEPSRDVLRLVAPELRADLRTALHLAGQQRSQVDVARVRLPEAGGDVLVTLTVRPALREDPLHGYFLVLFDAHAPGEAEPSAAPSGALQLHRPADSGLRGLEEELDRVKAQLRTTIEQHETDAEEARAANEELQAMNEELRSAAEELETSREELQSFNEELTTVNQELKIRIEELGLANNDLQNLINSTDIGTIFLDRSLRVKLSTPAVQQIFNLLPADIGRPLSDITSRLVGDESLHEDVVAVLERLQTIERKVQTRDGRSYLMRILPYRTTDDRIDGVSLTFHDITNWRQAEQRVLASEERLRLLIDRAVDYAIFTVCENGRVESWNSGAERMFGYRSEEIIGQDMAVLFTAEDRDAGAPARELATAREQGRASDDRWHVRKDGTRLYLSGVTTRLGDANVLGFAKIARDLTASRRGEIELQQARDTLEERVTERTGKLREEIARRALAQQEATELMRRLVTAQEDERARIARDLHDQLGQQVTALRLALQRHLEVHGEDGADRDLDQAMALAGDLDRQVDFLAWRLRPTALDDLGLAAALPRFVDEWAAHSGIAAHFQPTGTVRGRLTADAEVAFYRVAQEAMNNVLKHAHASRVDVLLDAHDDAVVLIVEDDGVGFDAAAQARTPSGMGLAGMRERARLIGATLTVEPRAAGGTAVYLRLPLLPDTRPPA